MKKMCMTLLALLLIVLMMACGKNDVPTDELIRMDVESALYEKNPHAQIENIETVKSREDEGIYEITLDITAETKYADWSYEVDLSYTEYDQGWILDEINWRSENYAQTRIPEVNTMVEYATSYLLSHDVYSDTEYMTPIKDADLQIHSESPSILQLNWNGVEPLMYATRIIPFSTLWQYDAAIDNWILVPNYEHGSLGYCVEWDNGGTIIPDDVDLSGKWHAQKGTALLTLGVADTIIISNFSWDTLDAEFPQLDPYIEIDPHFTRVDNDSFKFENKDGLYIWMSFAKDCITLELFVPSYDIPQAVAHVK